ncbi:MAG: VWA domain-containing protein [Methyloglobulus sp.]|nr:VWA domain-containing protein [Methyloglobulus sp.]
MNLTEFHFIRPYWLLALLPYTVLLVMFIKSKLSHGNWTTLCDEALLPYLLQDKAVAQSRWPLATGAVAALLAIIAMAGPTWERIPTPVFRNDAALVIVLDLSHSMDAGDIKPSRLTMARYKITDILKSRKDGQTALLVYAGDTFTVTPLTNDTETIDNQLNALTTEIMPNDGNNTGQALTKAVDLLKQAGLQKGQILLITDGGNIDEATAQAKSLGAYQLLVLGVGTGDGAPIALPTGGFLKDDQGGIIVEKLDFAGLEKLAQAGGGTYQTLTADDSDVRALFSDLTSTLQKEGGKNENLLLDQWSDKGPWLLLAVLPLAALCFRKGLLVLALCVLIPLPKNSYAIDLNWQDLWFTKDQQAQDAYNNGQFDKAAELFENPDWQAAAQYKSDQTVKGEMKEAKTAVGDYNQGNVYAVREEYEKAIGTYAKALNKFPDKQLKEDIEYNKKLVEEALQKKQKEQKQQEQKNKDKQDQDNKDKNQDSKDQQKQDQQQKDDQSGQPDQKKDGEKNKDEQKESEQKPEQKPEQSQENMKDQPEKQQSTEDQKQQDKPEAAKPEQAKEQPPEKNQDKKEDAVATQPIDNRTNEEKQAHEQWLKRIPDDPSGLLKRKFKYQYDRRRQQ